MLDRDFNTYKCHTIFALYMVFWFDSNQVYRTYDNIWMSYSISQEICTRFLLCCVCCGYTLTDFPISIRLTSLALWQSNDRPSASKATLMNMDKYFMWIYYERLHNHNKAKHNKTVCIFLGIYCKTFLSGITITSSKQSSQACGSIVSRELMMIFCDNHPIATKALIFNRAWWRGRPELLTQNRGQFLHKEIWLSLFPTHTSRQNTFYLLWWYHDRFYNPSLKKAIVSCAETWISLDTVYSRWCFLLFPNQHRMVKVLLNPRW